MKLRFNKTKKEFDTLLKDNERSGPRSSGSYLIEGGKCTKINGKLVIASMKDEFTPESAPIIIPKEGEL